MKTATNANKVLLRYLDSKKAKLAFSLKDRENLKALLDSGVKPTDNYRYDWLTHTATCMFDFLIPHMERFGVEHPNDVVSNKDLADLFISCLHKLGVKL
jgi:hypothetical protein